MLSKRIQKVESSGIRKVFELAARNKGEYVNFSIGQPHFKTALKLKDGARKAIEANYNAYAPTRGILDLRREIAVEIEKTRKIKAMPERVIVTAGTSGAIFLLFSSIFDPGDEVILPDPYFVLYSQVLNFLGVKIKFLDTYPDFHIDSKKLEKLISAKTKAIILNSPNNPTGAIYSRKEIGEVMKIAKASNLLIISDEIYSAFDYDGKFFSPLSIYPKTVLLSGFSKSHSIPGWRIGYAYGPGEIIEAMNRFQQYTFVCAPSFAQHAMLGQVGILPEKEIENYKKKRDFVYASLKDLYELNMPEGAFYAFVKIPAGKKNFIEKLLEHKLLAVPGGVFSKRNDYFRISFAVSDEDLKKGMEILKRVRE
jgi:aspartate aminotransferase/aminotransferase